MCHVCEPGFAVRLTRPLLRRIVGTQPLHHHVPQSGKVQHNQ
jgi:hypothetical protein